MSKPLLDAVAEVVKQHVSKAIGDELYELNQRLALLEARQPVRGEKGETGLNGLPGPAGANGEDGRDGIDGKDGKDGIDGKDGRDGIDGKDGSPGVDGRSGVDGKDGERGADGRDGRDALQLEILDGIDETRRYTRGTFATYRGGLVKAFRNTDPLPTGAELERHGWQVIVNGVASVDVGSSADEREIIWGVTPTTGKRVEFRTKSAFLRDRGIWNESETYEKGDGVTFGGSYWIKQGSQNGRPGANDSGWRLAVRKGRDAK